LLPIFLSTCFITTLNWWYKWYLSKNTSKPTHSCLVLTSIPL
jgi:hypothetical protein